MTLRYDLLGRPVGLDWPAVSAHCEQDPSVWRNASQVQPKRSGSRVPNEIETEIIRRHREGETAATICDAVGVSAPTVSAVLDRHEITENRGRGSRQRTPEHVADEIVRLYVEQQLPGAKIGELTGVRHATVYKILRRRGIQPRSQGTRSGVAA